MKKTTHSQAYIAELQKRLDDAKTKPSKQPDRVHNSGGGYRSDMEGVDPRAV